jgi:hypothetical protein
VASVVVLGYPVRRTTGLSRRAVSDFAVVDRYDGPPLTV